MEEQLATTFASFTRVSTIGEVMSASGSSLYVDEHIPNLVAISPRFEIIKTDAYKTGAVILQDKASCFPAYLLDPRVEDGDVIDSCAAPGNKTTHLASIVHSRNPDAGRTRPSIYAFERNPHRAKTLESMVKLAGGQDIIHVTPRQDFLKVDPDAATYRDVGCLLLDPSCSGSGIVGREGLPSIHLPEAFDPAAQKAAQNQNRKRKRSANEAPEEPAAQVLVDDDGEQTVVASEQELQARLDTLSSFQLILLEHAFKFPSARRITYSTCSVHAQENEGVVVRALNSEIARARGWRILARDRQVAGMKEWPVRGEDEAAGGDKVVADACIRSYKDDGRGVMGFFVAAFIREGEQGGPGERGTHAQGGQDDDAIEDFSNTLPPKGPRARSLSSSANKKSRGASKNSNDKTNGSGGIGGLAAPVDGNNKGNPEEGSGDEWGGFDD